MQSIIIALTHKKTCQCQAKDHRETKLLFSKKSLSHLKEELRFIYLVVVGGNVLL